MDSTQKSLQSANNLLLQCSNSILKKENLVELLLRPNLTLSQTEEENITFPWKCKLCIRTFRHKKKFELHLRRHVSSQTIDEAFSCLICHQELFRSWGAWKAHEKQCKGSDLPMPEHIFNVYDQVPSSDVL